MNFLDLFGKIYSLKFSKKYQIKKTNKVVINQFSIYH